MSELPAPLSPADCDLRDFPFLPLDIQRLFNSQFHALATDAAWRAGVTLWLKSFHQVPAGSVPDDDVSLARLAEMARDVKGWRKIKEMALYGWVKCSDGRLYHPVVAEKAAEALAGKKGQRSRTAKARLQALLTRLSKATDSMDAAHIETTVQTLLVDMSQHLSQNEFDAVAQSVTDSVTESKRKREGQGQGEGKGQGKVLRKTSVPIGTGADAPASQEELPQKSPSDMTKTELWAAGKSLLANAGMPIAQCGSFVGKLVKDHGDDIVIDAVRTTVVDRPADPASYLVALCLHRSGERQPTAQWWATDATILAEGTRLGLSARPGESMSTFKGRIQEKLGQVDKPAPIPPPAPPAAAEPASAKSVMPEGLNLKALVKPATDERTTC